MGPSSLRAFSLRRCQAELDTSIQSANEHLDRLVEDFESLEYILKPIQQSAKRLINQIQSSARCELTLSSDLTCKTNIFSHDDNMQDILEDWYSFASINTTLSGEYAVCLRKNLIDPMRLLKRSFEDIRAQIRAHNAQHLLLIKLQRKTITCGELEKTGANLVKQQDARQALVTRRIEYAKQTQRLLNDLTAFLSNSQGILKAQLEAFLNAEMTWIQSCERTMKQRMYMLQSSHSNGPIDRIGTMEDTMRALESLSICRDPR